MLDESYLNDLDLEKEILSYFLIDNTNQLISSTKLKDKHFLDERYSKVFKLFLKKYLETSKIDYKDILKDFDGNKEYQGIILDIFKYACYYVLKPNLNEFMANEDRLIEKWKKSAIREILVLYQENKMSYSELQMKMDDINAESTAKNLLDISDDIEDTVTSKEREYTNIRQLDFYLKGLEYGYVYLWTGITNAGKTTLMTQIANSLLKVGRKIFYFSGEQTAKEFKNSLYVSLCSKNEIEYIKDKNNQEIIDIVPKESTRAKLNQLLRQRLYVYNNEIPKNDIDTMIKVMSEAYKLGISIFFIDNFMQLDDSEMLEQQTKIMEKFKRFARNKNSIVNLVAHPRKTQFSSYRLNIMDISGTQNIANKASAIITVSRSDMIADDERDYIKKALARSGYLLDRCDAYIEVLKTKGNCNGMLGLTYDRDLKIYTENPKMSKEEYENIKNQLLPYKRKRT